MERAGKYELAGRAYEQEAALWQKCGDPNAAEVQRRRAKRLRTDLVFAAVAPSARDYPLARLEPETGCYIGALDDYQGRGAGGADELERKIGRPVAIAFEYDNYGQRFPMAWARRHAARGRAIQIAWEPGQGLAVVQDDYYLNRWARDAASCGTTVFLRFGGEMNGDWTPWGRDSAAYRRAFRLVHDVMARYAPNVLMVWAPNAVPTWNIDTYYPGDDVVDWVGISLYIVRYYDDDLSHPAWQDHPATFIEPFYRKYAARKPLCLVEYGVSRRSRVEGTDADAFAAARLHDLFDALRARFPRLKMVCAFDRNNLERARPGRRLNDYSLPEGSRALEAFRQITGDAYFLGRVAEEKAAGRSYRRLAGQLPAGYHGEVLASLSTYDLDAFLEVLRNGKMQSVPRPFRFTVPNGSGPLTVRVRDSQTRVAATFTLAAP
jgi:hypothetical protein